MRKKHLPMIVWAIAIGAVLFIVCGKLKPMGNRYSGGGGFGAVGIPDARGL